eukprot:CAMPEP_0197055786 /NCGR_PEP_ID=MMETSP1384-20130603/73120_1 /TAXON_ID=29189 /ORGANISM="Ammonia sp." /LENGTH=473 /DNA_ID=CAMNT_0042489479 /DNA_START=42 /DNA_END=1460 /DNA_ORIENTATION=-
MSSEWTTKSSKAGKKKKAAQHQKPPAAKASEKKKKKEGKQRTRQRKTGRNDGDDASYGGDENRNRSNNKNMYDGDEQPRLSNKQYQIMRQISKCFPDSKYDAILPKVIKRLDLDYFDPDNKQMRIDILTELVNEFQGSLGGSKPGKASKQQQAPKSTSPALHTAGSAITPRHEQRSAGRDRGDPRSRSSRQRGGREQPKRQQWSKRVKSGKFYRMMTDFGNPSQPSKRCVGSVLLDYLFIEKENYQTVFNLLRVQQFAFITEDERILSASHRVKLYTAPNDLLYRCKAFDMALDCTSSLRLYELRRCGKEVATALCLRLIIGNALNLDYKFRAKYEKTPIVSMNVAAKNIDGFSFVDKVFAQKCKQLNVWNANDIQDLNKAYLIEFVEYQKTQYSNFAVSAAGYNDEQRDGDMYLQYFDQFILKLDLVKRKNVKSLHFGYIKVINNFEVNRHLFAFVEVKATRQKETRQFVVW